MKSTYTHLLGLVVASYIVACAPVKFEKQVNCGSGFNCVSANGKNVYDYTTKISGGKVDIVFIDDNSASMSTEQNSIANRFSSFLSSLDNKNIDYRIGIITTDVSTSPYNSARAINQNGALQDGRLIVFGDGSSFLTPSTANKESLFGQAIKRNETLTCEAYLNTNPTAGQTSTSYQQNCPSPDERGIKAANLFVRGNPASMIRSDAHLAFVVLSDEDVRSSLYTKTTTYALETDDLPQTLIENVNNLYAGKSMSFHSIIVRPGQLVNGVTAEQVINGIATFASSKLEATQYFSQYFTGADVACLNVQSTQTNNVLGSYGYMYSLLTKMTGGIEGNICANDYGSQLSSIGDNIGQRVNDLQLACATPENLQLDFVSGTAVSFHIEGSVLKFDQALSAGTEVRVRYGCENN
ncbi:MAG: hypothetical protein BroJett040_05960 [Oligoflexia bacterium]|nr:MAG: hypothetical protein BroJett040_05960 [Oligoflexia bacterium]